MTRALLPSALAALLFSNMSIGQEKESSAPWLGVALPPALGSEPAVIVGNRAARAAIFASDTKRFSDLQGEAIRKDVETIVGFSNESRAARELGSGQLWGRVTGFPSSAKTIDWAIEELRRAGIDDVRTQPFDQDPNASFWIPQSWEVRLLGHATFGANSNDIVLESALPVSGSSIANGALTAPLIYVGTASPAVLNHIDIKGRIAVQLIVPQGHMVFERATMRSRTQDLFKRGAVAVLNLVRLPGNERSLDFGNCGGACFNVGGRDGHFLETVLNRASELGLQDKMQARLTLKTETRTGLKAHNGVAVIPGSKSSEAIVIDAHADAWFDGAGDNADGLAVMLALARHFARPAHKPERTLAFVVSAGHHTPGMNGPRNFVKANPELAKNSVLALNIEHVAQRNFSPARSQAADGYRYAVADSGEAPIVFGVSNAAPFLNELARQGVLRYGVNLVSEESTMQSGETGGFADLNVGKITVMQAPPLYHTTGEVTDVISTPGLERIAHFFAYFIEEVAKAPRKELLP